MHYSTDIKKNMLGYILNIRLLIYSYVLSFRQDRVHSLGKSSNRIFLIIRLAPVSHQSCSKIHCDIMQILLMDHASLGVVLVKLDVQCGSLGSTFMFYKNCALQDDTTALFLH